MADSERKHPVDLDAAKDRVMGDVAFLKEMLEMFEASVPTFLEAIRDAVEKQDAPALSRTAHQFKGAALNLSVLQVAEKAADLDKLGKDADFENVKEVLEALEEAVSDFREFMTGAAW